MLTHTHQHSPALAGVASAGELLEAPDFLRALAPYITVELRP
ncbi:hypothetical protein ACWC98_35825 [Streptomyces goshikiensis]